MATTFEHYIWRFGHIKCVALITVISILLSVAITFSIYYMFGEEVPKTTLFVCIFAPLVIAPLVTSFLVKLVIKIYLLEKEMREMATRDGLTGLLTRRHFMELATSYYHLAERNNYVFSVIMIDIDHFKNINDKFGHPAGDEILKAIGNIFRKTMRRSDIIGRYGGEEFICILPGTGRNKILKFCNAFHKKMGNTNIDYAGSNISFTVSIGVTSYDSSVNNAGLYDLIKQADEALYKAKHRGRNCTEQF